MITYKSNFTAGNTDSKFGISAFSGDKLVRCIYEITDSKADIDKLVDMCNECKLDICHIDDIVEDYLTDFSV